MMQKRMQSSLAAPGKMKTERQQELFKETLHTKANDHLTFGYFEKAIINFHQAIKKGISNS